MTAAGWASLRNELRNWSDSGLRLPIWWRDDDACQATAQLDRLRSLAREVSMPVHLAIVPAVAQPDLGAWLAGDPFRGVVHGWSHRNHAPAGEKASEFGRPRAEAAEEAARGLARLRDLYGDDVHPMFVPPWNRIADSLIPRLADCGYQALSTFGPRSKALAAPGLAAVNTHVDPVDWRGTRGLVDADTLRRRLVDHLRARRTGQADPREPLGLLTHHLMMDDATWAFCRDLLGELCAGPVTLYDIASGEDIP